MSRTLAEDIDNAGVTTAWVALEDDKETKVISNGMVDIAKYIGVKLANPDAAERLAEKMAESAEDLANMPYKCPMYIPVKPLKHEYRKLIVHNYIMFYWIDEDKKLVTIARVVYSGRDYEKLL